MIKKIKNKTLEHSVDEAINARKLTAEQLNGDQLAACFALEDLARKSFNPEHVKRLPKLILKELGYILEIHIDDSPPKDITYDDELVVKVPLPSNPVISDTEYRGWLEIKTSEGAPIHHQDNPFFSYFAEIVGRIMDHAELYVRMRQDEEEIRDILALVVKDIEAPFEGISRWIERVDKLMLRIAEDKEVCPIKVQNQLDQYSRLNGLIFYLVSQTHNAIDLLIALSLDQEDITAKNGPIAGVNYFESLFTGRSVTKKIEKEGITAVAYLHKSLNRLPLKITRKYFDNIFTNIMGKVAEFAIEGRDANVMIYVDKERNRLCFEAETVTDKITDIAELNRLLREGYKSVPYDSRKEKGLDSTIIELYFVNRILEKGYDGALSVRMDSRPLIDSPERKKKEYSMIIHIPNNQPHSDSLSNQDSSNYFCIKAEIPLEKVR